MSAVLAGSIVLPARAADPSYAAMAAIRLVDLDFRGSRGQVQEYNGKLYRGAEGDVFVGNQGTYGLFDLSVKDIGSTEEDAALNVDYKDTLKLSALWNNMHHRLNERRAGMIINNVYVINPQIVSSLTPDENLLIRRTESQLAAGMFEAGNSARWVTVRYWSAEKAGSTAFHAGTYQLGRANIDNLTQDFELGFGTNLGDQAAMALDLIHRDFKDHSEEVRYPAALGRILKPALPHTNMNGAEARFRFDPSAKLALTAAVSGKERRSLTNQFESTAVVGTFNAAYKAAKSLSLTARLYFRGSQVDESVGFKAIVPGELTNTHQIDKNLVRGELAATWRPAPKVSVKGGYKLEYTTRRGAPTEVFSTPAGFFDGTLLPAGSWVNSVPRSDTRHTVSVGSKVELPLGVDVEVDYKRLQANRAAFVGQPNWQNDMNAAVTVALPADVQLLLLAGYIDERNTANQESRNYNGKRNTYRGSLDWAANARTFLGLDGSYESIRTVFHGRFGSGTTPPATPVAFYESGMVNTQRNTVAGLHGRFNLPKGVAFTARGSYTWSKVQTPLHYLNVPLNYTVNDYSPSDVRIARGGVGVEYTPEKLKNLTARAGYRIDDWSDKTDSFNSGRASYSELGVAMKF